MSVAIDSAKQRQIMGRFATGVTVASTAMGETTWGMTANAVTSLSLNPALVLFAVVRNSQSHAMFAQARCFALNILAEDQLDISNRFAFAGPKDFSGLTYRKAVTGAPILEGVLGWVDCRLVNVVDGGDHDIFIGEIEDGDFRDGRPLLYYSGKYAQIAMPTA